MSRKVLLLLAVLFSIGFRQTNGQNVKLPQIIPPSPDAASLGKFGDIPVSTYTGIPNISIPLHEISARDIKVPISIAYHASGLRVEEESSFVGLGWGIQVGGSISRTVRGNDDLGHSTPGHPGYTGIPGYVYSTAIPRTWSPSEGVYVSPLNYVEQVCLGGTDSQPDVFTYNFLGYSGKFYLTKKVNVNDPVKVMLRSDHERISISYNEVEKKWTILTKEGIKAVFATKEYTNSLSGAIDNLDNPPNPLNWEPRPDVVSSWYLDTLYSVTREPIVFTYDIPAGQSKPLYASRGIMSINESSTKIAAYRDAVVREKGIRLHTANPVMAQGAPCENVQSKYSGSVSVTWNVYPKAIQFANGELRFVTSERSDIDRHVSTTHTFAYPRKLDAIEVYQNGVKLKTINFQYSYYNNGETLKPFLFKRLQLTAIQEVSGASSKKPYTFTYNGNTLPAKNSAAKDHWGLYNGKTGNDHFNGGRPSFVPALSYRSSDNMVHNVPGADRSTDEASAMTGILKKVVYPTGGSTEFFFESHVVTEQAFIANPLQREYFAVSNSLAGTTKVFELTHQAVVGIMAEIKCPTLSCYPGGSGTTPCTYNSSMVGSPYVKIKNLATGVTVFTAFYGDYECKHSSQAACATGVQTTHCGIKRSGQLQLAAGRYILETYSLHGFQSEANVSYTLNLLANPQTQLIHQKGGGLRVARTVDSDGLSAANNIVRRFDYTTTSPRGESMSSGRYMTVPSYHSMEYFTLSGGDYVVDCNLIKSASYSNVPLGTSAQGSPVGYDKVTVIYGENGENGTTVYTYINEPDDTLKYFLPGAPTMDRSTRNGMVLSETHYTRDKFKVKEITNNYHTDTISTIPAVYAYSTNACGANQKGTIGYIHYDEKSEWTRLLNTTEKIYDQLDASNARNVEMFTSYAYNNSHRMVIREFQNTSEGKTLRTDYYYPLDLPSSGTPEMWDPTNANYKHMHSVLLKKEVWDVTSTAFVQGINNVYAYNGTRKLVLPTTAREARNDGTYETKLFFDEYDSKGNVLQLHSVNEPPVSFIWGYGNSLPVAEAKNASHGQIYYEGFETHASGTENIANSHSGRRHKLTSFAIPFNPPAGSEYELSYWKYEGAKWVAVRQAYTGPITITGTRLDDIRIYPVGAHMTTYDFDPLVGMITATDVNNNVARYTYDEFQRLIQVQDLEQQVIKGFKYRYKD